MPSITPIPAFTDNYIWCLSDGETGKALIVDPGQAKPVLQHLAANGLLLDTILVTHHHPDHTGGIAKLAEAFPDCRIAGPAHSPFSGIKEPVGQGDTVSWMGMDFSVIAVPGHTLDHIAFYSQARVSGRPVLFCGDTLFVSGCGRLFEGTPAQMKQSLGQLRRLPEETAVYCAHEYTLANLRFARHWLPSDAGLEALEQKCQRLRERGEPTVPSTIADEKACNPFMRWDDSAVAESAQRYAEKIGLPCVTEEDVFAATRHGKDNF